MPSKITHKTNSAAEEREARMDNAVKSVAKKERCQKHNMIFEYCGFCQRVEWEEESKFPLPVTNKETGEPVLRKDGKQRVAWIPVKAKCVDYYRYR